MQAPAAAPESATGGEPIAPPEVAAAERCANCGAQLLGQYCSQCGQRHEHLIHSFSHFVREATEDLTHADSRLWRTLFRLLFRPGSLTREFLDGRRARYLPPVRLYLVLSVLFFVIVGLVPQTLADRAQLEIVNARAAAAAAAAARDSATGRAAGNPGGKDGMIILTPFGVAGLGAGPVGYDRAQRICARFSYDGPLAGHFAPRIEASCVRAVMDDGREFRQAFLENIGKAMFVLLPLLALAMKALYRRPPRHYVEHLLFFVHNHAFLYVVMAAYMVLAALAPGAFRQVFYDGLWIAILVYFYLSMRRVYGQGWLLTCGKMAALWGAYIVLGAATMAATALYSFLTP